MTAGKFIFMLFFSLLAAACSQGGKITKVETTQYAFRDTVNAGIDSVMEKEIQPYRESMSGKMNEVIATSDVALTKGQPESLLGNLFSDACLQMANDIYYASTYSKADFAFFNNGGLRAELPKGSITMRNVFELMPFENELVVMTLNGGQMKKLLDFIAAKDGVPVSNLRFKIRDKAPLEAYINNMPFDSTKSYKAVTSDYLAGGGDQYFFLTDAKKEYLNLKIRDCMVQYLKMQSREGKTITANLDQRISYVK